MVSLCPVGCVCRNTKTQFWKCDNRSCFLGRLRQFLTVRLAGEDLDALFQQELARRKAAAGKAGGNGSTTSSSSSSSSSGSGPFSGPPPPPSFGRESADTPPQLKKSRELNSEGLEVRPGKGVPCSCSMLSWACFCPCLVRLVRQVRPTCRDSIVLRHTVTELPRGCCL